VLPLEVERGLREGELRFPSPQASFLSTGSRAAGKATVLDPKRELQAPCPAVEEPLDTPRVQFCTPLEGLDLDTGSGNVTYLFRTVALVPLRGTDAKLGSELLLRTFADLTSRCVSSASLATSLILSRQLRSPISER